jgi:hypothetical protein
MAKWKRTYSEVFGFVRSRLSITLVRTTSMCLRGSRDPTARVNHATGKLTVNTCHWIRFKTKHWNTSTTLAAIAFVYSVSSSTKLVLELREYTAPMAAGVVDVFHNLASLQSIHATGSASKRSIGKHRQLRLPSLRY